MRWIVCSFLFAVTAFTATHDREALAQKKEGYRGLVVHCPDPNDQVNKTFDCCGSWDFAGDPMTCVLWDKNNLPVAAGFPVSGPPNWKFSFKLLNIPMNPCKLTVTAVHNLVPTTKDVQPVDVVAAGGKDCMGATDCNARTIALQVVKQTKRNLEVGGVSELNRKLTAYLIDENNKLPSRVQPISGTKKFEFSMEAIAPGSYLLLISADQGGGSITRPVVVK